MLDNISIISENFDYEYLIYNQHEIIDNIEKTIINSLENKINRKIVPKNQINKNRSPHTNLYADNIRIKIIIHFCNYLIQFLNDYVKKIFGYQKRKFRKVSHKYKINIFGNSLQKLMNLTIEEFCKLDISSKYKKKQNKKQNELNFEFLKINFRNEFIKKKLLYFFSNFYMENDLEKTEKIKEYYGLSDKILNFQCLCKKQKLSNYVIKLKKESLKILNINYLEEESNLKINEENKSMNYQILITSDNKSTQ